MGKEWIILIIVFLVSLALCIGFTIWVASSDLPLWLKFFLLRR